MKKQIIFILLLTFFFTNCERDESIKYFPPEKISELSLNNIESFWENDTINNISDYVTENFNADSCHLVSLRYSSKAHKVIAVSVFKSRESAVNAMEKRRRNVACLFENGTSDEIEGTWWFANCLPPGVFVNKLNTIIEVSYYNKEIEEVKNIVYPTANEIAERIDELSIIME
jgi:hypothetical protein